MDQAVKVLALAHYLEAWEGLGAGAGGRRIDETARLFSLLSSSQTSETALDRTRPLSQHHRHRRRRPFSPSCWVLRALGTLPSSRLHLARSCLLGVVSQS